MKDKRKRRQTAVIALSAAVLITAVLIYAAPFTGGRSQTEKTEEYEGVIRFHVRANSDSEEDQALKLKVRDGVLEGIDRILLNEYVRRYGEDKDKDPESVSGGFTLSQTREILYDNLDNIENIARDIIREKGYNYSAKAKIGITSIPEKTYGDVTFPAGNYEALTIDIGKGEGHNWWCVLFPPLCIIDPSGSTLDSIEKDSAGCGKTKIVLRFRTQEIFR